MSWVGCGLQNNAGSAGVKELKVTLIVGYRSWVLLYGIAGWGLAPLLQASDAALCQNEPPTSCSNLPPHQLALHIKWTVEEHEFHSVLFTHGKQVLRNIIVGAFC